jgi:mannose-6-phosphate isomerase-like protein (cupin superfamily)
MIVKNFSNCPEFIAGDKTVLRELLNPLHEPLECRYSLAHASLAPGHTSILHRLKTCEVYFILSGFGNMEIDDEIRAVSSGDTLYIPPCAKQRITNTGSAELRFLCIVDPAWRAQDEEIL